MKEERARPRALILGAAAVIVLLALFAGLYAAWTVRSLQSALADTQARLARSEEARFSELKDLQKEIGSLRQKGTSDGSRLTKISPRPCGPGKSGASWS